MKKKINIVIIGLGPRGVSILERLTAILPQSNIKQKICINIVEPHNLGEGIHSSDQPDYLLLNTVCSQITFFTDASVKNAGPVNAGPSLYEWVLAQGYGYTSDKKISLNAKHPIGPNDYLPRAIFGKYLQAIAKQFVAQLRQQYSVIIHQTRAQDIRVVTADQYQIALENKQVIIGDYIFLTTGHSINKLNERDITFTKSVAENKANNPKLQYIADCYPIAKLPALVDEHIKVAIEGFGLTALDILAALTVGKGGQFIVGTKPSQLIYEKSGHEPKIVMYSLDGLPLNGRAINQKGISQQYQAHFFTKNCIDELREKYGIGEDKQLDFELHLLPQLQKEIYHCYYVTWLKMHVSERSAAEFTHFFMRSCYSIQAVDAIIKTFIPKTARLSWSEFFNPLSNLNLTNLTVFKQWLIEYLVKDIQECYLGNVGSAYKAACDVMRDIRDNMRYLIDFAGLTPASHQAFLQKYMPFLNRISVGPPKERVAEMLALIQAGILDVFIGPDPVVNFSHSQHQFEIIGRAIKYNFPRYIDILIKARIPAPLPKQDMSALMTNCLRRGLLQPFYNGHFHPGGIKIDKNFHPIDLHNKVHTNIWAIGTLVEGPKFYTYIVPRAGVNSTGLQDAGRAVLAMAAALKKQLTVYKIQPSTAVTYVPTSIERNPIKNKLIK